MFNVNERPLNEKDILSNWKDDENLTTFVKHLRDEPIYAKLPEHLQRDGVRFYSAIKRALMLTRTESVDCKNQNLTYLKEHYGLDVATPDDHMRYHLVMWDYTFSFIIDIPERITP